MGIEERRLLPLYVPRTAKPVQQVKENGWYLSIKLEVLGNDLVTNRWLRPHSVILCKLAVACD